MSDNKSLVSELLITLTESIKQSGEEIAVQGILGGEYGYGAQFKNDVFEMRPFYWGDCECGQEDKENEWEASHSHKDDCYRTIRHNNCFTDPESYDWKDGHGHDKCDCDEKLCAEMGLSYPEGSAVHCTCGMTQEWYEWLEQNRHQEWCGYVAPNFKHYESGVEIRWYKYIGRGMEISNAEYLTGSDWLNIFNQCMNSVKK